MNEKVFYFFQVSSTISVVPAFLILVFRIKKSDLKIKLFAGLLLIGFITDALGWYFFITENSRMNTYARYIYNLIEALFWFWLVAQVASQQKVKLIYSRAWVLFLPLWLLIFINADVINLFESATYVFVAFGSSYCLLGLIETRSDPSETTIFWMLLGTFFYCFSVFFILGISFSQLAVKIWYAHSVINILTNLIFLWGFIRARELA